MACLKPQIFENQFILWNELIFFVILKQLACSNPIFLKLIQSMKWVELLQSFIDQIDCLKNWLFGKLFQSRNGIEILIVFRKVNQYFRKLIQSLKWTENTKNVCEPIQYIKKIDLKTSNFSQTDSVVQMNWWTSKLRSSNSLLEKLKFSQTDSNYKKNWYTSKLESSNSSLTNPVYEMNKKTNNLRELIQYIKKNLIFLSFLKLE